MNASSACAAPTATLVHDSPRLTPLATPVNLVLKRTLDITCASTALLVLAPVLLLLAVLVKLHDPAGPVFYRQNRVGRGGAAIAVLKFRSMAWAYSTGPDRPYQTAQQAFRAMGREDLCEEFEREQKVLEDPRVSALGRFLRSTSLDELPQLLNAVRGDLSLVGPRPVVQQELERYGDAADHYLAVKPGITGLWQVSGRSATGYEERVRLDVRYVTRWRPSLDLTILARTVGVVRLRQGAC